MKKSETAWEACLIRALPAVREAGQAILDVYHGHIDVTYKEDETPLTLADKRSHAVIGLHLSAASEPQMPVLSEEGKHTPYETRKLWKDFWLVDPLDGTKEFIKRRDEFTVNIAVIHDKRPVMGVVCLPAKGMVYFAAEGLGAYRLEDWEIITRFFGDRGHPEEGRESLESVLRSSRLLPLEPSANSSEKRLRVVGSRSHATKELEQFVEAARQAYHDIEFLPAGSALKFGLVAEGTAQIYPRFGPTMEWDTGAGQCVVEQSGGAVLHLKERIPLAYNKADLVNPGFICIGRHPGNVQFLIHEQQEGH